MMLVILAATSVFYALIVAGTLVWLWLWGRLGRLELLTFRHRRG